MVSPAREGSWVVQSYDAVQDSPTQPPPPSAQLAEFQRARNQLRAFLQASPSPAHPRPPAPPPPLQSSVAARLLGGRLRLWRAAR